MKYKMIRCEQQKARCTDPIKGRLYCPCGCQAPHDDDPQPNFSDVCISGKANHGYADYVLTRNGQPVGELNTQYSALFLDDVEYLGCSGDDIQYLVNQARNTPSPKTENTQSGDTLEETAAAVRLMDRVDEIEENERNKHHPGWCTKCHSYCYGDCTASQEV
jgi:hypothetical protein